MTRSPRLDLNLVRVFNVIYETGSLTSASERLFITQPTVSYSLAKLREALNDQLFVRTREGMVPTACAIQTYERFSSGMAQIDHAVEQTSRFVPELSERRFRVAMSDVGELIFISPILKKLTPLAPKIELEVVQMAMDDLPNWLALGRVDAAIGHLPTICDVTRNAHLFDEHYVCLLRQDHPTIRGILSLEAFVAAPHVSVSSSFFVQNQVEEELQKLGLKVRLRIPHFTILPGLISTTDLIVVLPYRVATSFEPYGGLQILALPIELPKFDVRLHWDGGHEGLASHQWLLKLLTEAVGPL